MDDFYNAFLQLCAGAHVSPSRVAESIGLSRTAPNGWKKGKIPNDVTIVKLANYFNVPIEYFSEKWDKEKLNTVFGTELNILSMPKMNTVPLVGTIACGTPILAEQNVECVVDLPEHISADFALRCKGDSMINARIYDGDIVYIRQQPTVEDGQIAAVLIGDEATLKRVHLYPDHIVLEPENPLYRPLVFWESEMETVRILGRAVAFTSVVR